MPTNPKPRIMCETPVRCGNPDCDWAGDIDDTREIRDFWGRVEPGDEMPTGECPECGWLAYLVKSEEQPIRVIAVVEGGVLQFARCSRPVNFDVADLDNLACGSGDEEESRIKALAAEAESLPHQCF